LGLSDHVRFGPDRDRIADVGGALAESTYFTAINSQRRILLALGLDRRSRNITPLNDLLAQLDREQAATVENEGVE
jgi:hypothetical protein